MKDNRLTVRGDRLTATKTPTTARLLRDDYIHVSCLALVAIAIGLLWVYEHLLLRFLLSDEMMSGALTSLHGQLLHGASRDMLYTFFFGTDRSTLRLIGRAWQC